MNRGQHFPQRFQMILNLSSKVAFSAISWTKIVQENTSATQHMKETVAWSFNFCRYKFINRRGQLCNQFKNVLNKKASKLDDSRPSYKSTLPSLSLPISVPPLLSIQRPIPVVSFGGRRRRVPLGCRIDKLSDILLIPDPPGGKGGHS